MAKAEPGSSLLVHAVRPSFQLAFPTSVQAYSPPNAAVVPAHSGDGSASLVSFILCRIQYHFGEFGNYSLVVKTLSASTKTVSCDLVINEGPINSYLRM